MKFYIAMMKRKYNPWHAREQRLKFSEKQSGNKLQFFQISYMLVQ